MLGKDGFFRVLVKTKTKETLEVLASETDITLSELVRRIIENNLDFFSMDLYEYTKKIRKDRADGLKRTPINMIFPPILAERVVKQADKCRTFITEWVDELLERETKKYRKEKDNVEHGSH